MFDSMPQVYFTMNILHESWVFGSLSLLRAVICVGKIIKLEKGNTAKRKKANINTFEFGNTA